MGNSEIHKLTFGDKFKSLRLERGWSQEEMATFLGTTKQVISRYETNQRTPKITIAAEYAQKLGISLSYLINDGFDNHAEPIGGKNAIVAAHRADPFADLPVEAQEQLEEYIEFLRAKYKIDK